MHNCIYIYTYMWTYSKNVHCEIYHPKSTRSPRPPNVKDRRPRCWETSWKGGGRGFTEDVRIPIGSMYGIYANIWGILMVNVSIYTIHGSYGIGCFIMSYECTTLSLPLKNGFMMLHVVFTEKIHERSQEHRPSHNLTEQWRILPARGCLAAYCPPGSGWKANQRSNFSSHLEDWLAPNCDWRSLTMTRWWKGCGEREWNQQLKSFSRHQQMTGLQLGSMASY